MALLEGSDGDHKHPSSAEVKNAWIYTTMQRHGIVLSSTKGLLYFDILLQCYAILRVFTYEIRIIEFI